MRLQPAILLRPWHEARRQRARAEALDARLSSCTRALGDCATRADRLDRANANLRAQLRASQAAAGGVPSTETPDFVLVGIPRGAQGVRLIASRNLTGTSFGMTPAGDPPPRWVVRATLAQALFIDHTDYPMALARLHEIWANWEQGAAAVRPAQLRADELRALDAPGD